MRCTQRQSSSPVYSPRVFCSICEGIWKKVILDANSISYGRLKEVEAYCYCLVGSSDSPYPATGQLLSEEGGKNKP